MLTKIHLETVCLANGPVYLRCRYIGYADGDPGTALCNKISCHKKDIDREVEQELQRMKADGKSPVYEDYPIGDNCPGYPIFYDLPQGIDVDKP